MKNRILPAEVRPIVPTFEALLRVKQMGATPWPCNLRRFSLFKRKMNGSELEFRAISWDPHSRRLYVLRVEPGVSPDRFRSTEYIYVVNENELNEEILHVAENIRQPFMLPNAESIPAACLKGLSTRNMLINAVLMLDPDGNGICESYLFNDEIISNSSARSESIHRVCRELGKEVSGYRPYLLKLLTKFLWFGGGPSALMNLSPSQGGPGVSRVGKNLLKPGRLSSLEELEKVRAQYAGNTINNLKKQRPVAPADLKKFLIVLTECWAKRRMSYQESYCELIQHHYLKHPKRSCPTIRMFKFHAGKLIRDHNLKRLRNGSILSVQHNDARVGQSSDITQGVIEVLDVDGFVPKLAIRAMVMGKIVGIPIKVLLCVTRLSHVVLGYEIALKGENAESFRRCIASAFLSKFDRAFELGLPSYDGLLHGNVDAIFVDNGAGASESVIDAACDKMNLMRFLPPPGRGDLKGVVEGVNGLMVTLMKNENTAYTRKKDLLSIDTRRQKRKDAPIPLDEFERLLLKAINFHNLYSNVERLRTARMRESGIGITPACIFRYTQNQRRGDAARAFSKIEIFDRFLPWKSKACRKGLVLFASARYSSDELTEYFNEYVKSPGKVENPMVEVKRVSGSSKSLLWRKPDGKICVLEMIAEDQRRLDTTSWKAMELCRLDELIQEENLHHKRTRARGEVKVTQHEKILAAERGRGNPIAGLQGSSVKLARENAIRERDERRSLDELDAYNINSLVHSVKLDETNVGLDEVGQFESDIYASLGFNRKSDRG